MAQLSSSFENLGFTYLQKAAKYRDMAKRRLMKKHQTFITMIHDAFAISPGMTADIHQRDYDRPSYFPPASVDVEFVFPSGQYVPTLTSSPSTHVEASSPSADQGKP